MNRVVYYARVSTEEEQQASALKTQCRENEDFINSRKNWELVDKYIDEGKSGTTVTGRKEFSRLLADMEDDKFDVILIKQIDRGWRNLADWKMFEKELIRRQKRLFIRLRNEFYNIEDDGNYISTTMDSMFAEWYSRNLSRKMNNAHKTRMKKGSVVTNGKLWGYDQVNGNLVINEKEADVVRRVFDMYVQGKGFRTISLELDALGFRNQNGSTFALTTLKRMIRNEKYKGTLVCGKRHLNFFTKEYEDVPEEDWIIHEHRVPAIVSTEIWDEANRILQKRRKELSIEEKTKINGHFNGSYPLSGKIKCGKCGKPYYHSLAMIGPKGHKERVGIWQCSSYKKYGKYHEKGCDNNSIYEEELHSLLRTELFRLWKNRDQVLCEVMDVLGKVFSDESLSTETVEKFEADIQRIQNKKDQLIDLYSDQLISKDDFKRKVTHLDDSIKELQHQIDIVSQKTKEMDNTADRLKSIKEFFDMGFNDQNGINDDIIKAFVHKLTITDDDQIDIEFNGLEHHNANAWGSHRYARGHGCSHLR